MILRTIWSVFRLTTMGITAGKACRMRRVKRGGYSKALRLKLRTRPLYLPVFHDILVSAFKFGGD